MYQTCQVGSWEEKLTPQPEVFIHFSVEKQVSLRSAATSLLQLGNKCRYKMFQSISWNKNNSQVFNYLWILQTFLLSPGRSSLVLDELTTQSWERRKDVSIHLFLHADLISLSPFFPFTLSLLTGKNEVVVTPEQPFHCHSYWPEVHVLWSPSSWDAHQWVLLKKERQNGFSLMDISVQHQGVEVSSLREERTWSWELFCYVTDCHWGKEERDNCA